MLAIMFWMSALPATTELVSNFNVSAFKKPQTDEEDEDDD